jgi:hypothetical protein
MKRRQLYLKTKFLPRSKHFSIAVMKTNQLAFYRAEVATCYEINTKHTNTVWQDVTFLNAKPFGASHNQ